MRRISCNGKAIIFLSRRDLSIMHFPLWDFKAGNTERAQARPHVLGNGAKIFADHARSAGFVQSDTQIFFTVALVCLAALSGLVVSRDEMRSAAASLLKHLAPIEREKLFVLTWTPRESVNAIKTEHVIDAEEMKNACDCAHTFAPPRKIVRAHPVPVIKRDTPVLAPFLGELILFEIGFGRGPAGPIEYEFIRVRENVGAMIADAEWDIAHQCDAVFLSI